MTDGEPHDAAPPTESTKARRERINADLAEIKLAERRRLLIRRDQAELEGLAFAGAVAGKLLALADLAITRGIIVSPDQEDALRAMCLDALADMAAWTMPEDDGAEHEHAPDVSATPLMPAWVAVLRRQVGGDLDLSAQPAGPEAPGWSREVRLMIVRSVAKGLPPAMGEALARRAHAVKSPADLVAILRRVMPEPPTNP